MSRLARPEHELLTYVARRSLDLSEIQRVRELLAGHLDWTYLLASAHRHGVVQLLYYHVNEVCPEAVPSQVLSRLRTRYEENSRQNLSLTGELLKLLAVFEANGIETIPFKGPALAQIAYGDLGLRQFNDLDLLVHKRDVPGVMNALLDLGFQATPRLTAAQQTALFQFDCACNFVNQENVLVDVHWNITAPYYSLEVELDRFWDRLEPIRIGNKELLTFPAEDLLLILCLHSFTHFWERLGWISDIAALLDHNRGIDWDLVLSNAERQGTRRILSLGLRLANDLLEAPVPADVLRTVNADSAVRAQAEQVQKRLFDENPTSSGIWDETLLHLKMRERKRDRFKACLRLAFSPRVNDWTALALPSGFSFLYYLLRPLRLAGKYGARLMKSPGTEGV